MIITESIASSHRRLNRLHQLVGLGAVSLIALVAIACGQNPSGGSSQQNQAFSVVLPFFPTPESGGWYTAQAEGLFQKAGLNVTLIPGGPQVSQVSIVAAGRAQLGITDAESLLNARDQGIPVVAVAAEYQLNPAGVMVHADSGISSWQQMDGHKWVVAQENYGFRWVAREYNLSHIQTIAYTGSLALFLHDKSIINIGFETNEPYTAQAQGVKVNFFRFGDAGYDTYNDVIFAREDYLKSNGSSVRAFLQAGLQGWADYMGNISAATKGNDALMVANPNQIKAGEWYAWDKQRQFIAGGDAATQGIGWMTAERWASNITAMKSLGGLTHTQNIPADSVFTTQYLPKVLAPTSLPSAPQGSY